MVRLRGDAAEAMGEGLDRIREECDIPSGFPIDVMLAADEAAARPLGAEHADRTDRHFATLDPASSVDLDQAFAIEAPSGRGGDIVLHYAIADVGWFVRPGDPLDEEAFRRGVTIYLPDRRATLYPQILSEGAASLLPDVDRPAVVFTVRIDEAGAVRLDGVERARIRSRAKLAYDQVSGGDLPTGFDELFHRFRVAEEQRGAPRVEFPEQEVGRNANGDYELSFRPRLDSEEQNAALSLSTNLAVADALHAAGTGLFRVMGAVDDRGLRRLRNSARAFGLEWPADMTLAEFEAALPRTDPRTSAFLLAVRRASGGAAYAPYREGERPWHSAVAATYAQATAPLRRLQDRYVIEAALAVANGRPVPDEVTQAFERLPKAMARADQRANRAEKMVLELAEAVVLSAHIGEIFGAVVVDEGHDGDQPWAEIQIADPPVIARIDARNVDPGDTVRVRVESVDVDTRTVAYQRVS